MRTALVLFGAVYGLALGGEGLLYHYYALPHQRIRGGTFGVFLLWCLLALGVYCLAQVFRIGAD